MLSFSPTCLQYPLPAKLRTLVQHVQIPNQLNSAIVNSMRFLRMCGEDLGEERQEGALPLSLSELRVQVPFALWKARYSPRTNINSAEAPPRASKERSLQRKTLPLSNLGGPKIPNSLLLLH